MRNDDTDHIRSCQESIHRCDEPNPNIGTHVLTRNIRDLLDLNCANLFIDGTAEIIVLLRRESGV